MKAHNEILSNLRESERLDEYTKWTHLAGPRYKHMDQKYQKDIQTKLFPLLKKYGINMILRPIEDTPGSQVYIGRDQKGNRVSLEFINKYEPGLDNRISKNDMFVKVGYDYNTTDGGVIDLSKKSNIEDAFSIITIALEELGAFNKDESKESSKEIDPDVEELVKFKNSLTEQELKDIIK